MYLCLPIALDLGLGVWTWEGATIVPSLRRRKEEELFNEFSSQPEDRIWLVSVSHSYGDNIFRANQGADTRICVPSRCERHLGKGD